jgi:hypothetical protein
MVHRICCGMCIYRLLARVNHLDSFEPSYVMHTVMHGVRCMMYGKRCVHAYACVHAVDCGKWRCTEGLFRSHHSEHPAPEAALGQPSSHTMKHIRSKSSSSQKSHALHRNSLVHGLQQASAVAASTSAPHIVAATRTPSLDQTWQVTRAIDTYACVRSVLGVTKEALEACPVSGPKAAAGALAEVLKLCQVRRPRPLAHPLTSSRADESRKHERAERARFHNLRNQVHHLIVRAVRWTAGRRS